MARGPLHTTQHPEDPSHPGQNWRSISTATLAPFPRGASHYSPLRPACAGQSNQALGGLPENLRRIRKALPEISTKATGPRRVPYGPHTGAGQAARDTSV